MWRSVTMGWPRPIFLLAAGLLGALLCGAGTAPPQRETIELFAGIEKGQLDVKIFPRDSRESRLLLANKTGRPIRIALPDAFAAVPVLAQFQGMPMPEMALQNQKQLQPIGASPPMAARDQPMFFNGMAPNQRGLANRNDFPLMFPRGPAFFNVEPEKVIPVKLRTVCLEFGKGEPNPRVTYQVKPLEAVTRKPGVHEVCRLLAGDLDQKIIQAAAWHLNNGFGWQELERKHYKSDFGLSEPIFTSRQIKEGKRLAAAALEQAKPPEGPPAKSSGGK